MPWFFLSFFGSLSCLPHTLLFVQPASKAKSMRQKLARITSEVSFWVQITRAHDLVGSSLVLTRRSFPYPSPLPSPGPVRHDLPSLSIPATMSLPTALGGCDFARLPAPSTHGELSLSFFLVPGPALVSDWVQRPTQQGTDTLKYAT